MPRPPREPDDPSDDLPPRAGRARDDEGGEDIDDVLGRVSDTLDELHVVDGAEREALLGGLREVLGALGELPGTVEVRSVRIGVEPLPGEALAGEPVSLSRPSVRLMEGGLADDAPAEPGVRPDLRIHAGDEGSIEAPFHEAELPELDRGLVVKRIAGPRAKAGSSPNDGWSVIRLDGELGREAWQTVFAGRGPRAYRLQCSRGELRVYADGEPITVLSTGQSLDVESSLLRVSAEGVVRGRYLRLSS